MNREKQHGSLPPLKEARVLDQLRERIRYLSYSIRKEDAYVYWESFPTWYESEPWVVFPPRNESERG